MLKTLKEFSSHLVASSPELLQLQVFPPSLFQEMGDLGLLGATDLISIANGNAVIAGETGSLGLAMAWAGQALVPLALDHYAGLPQQVKADVASGRTILSIAVSEPEVGAHPKYLSTTATHTPTGWQLNGKKSFVTNGPIASHIAVLALTGSVAARKEYSLFLVPAGSPGLTPVEYEQFDFLHPAQHCGFSLDSVEVPESAMIGRLGKAYEDVVLPFRSLEDAVDSAGLIAALARAARLSAALLAPTFTQEIAISFGELAGIEIALQDLNAAIIETLESWNTETEVVGIRLIAIRDLARRAIEILKSGGANDDKHISCILRDAEKYLVIARTVHSVMKARLGLSYFISTNN